MFIIAIIITLSGIFPLKKLRVLVDDYPRDILQNKLNMIEMKCKVNCMIKKIR